MLLTKPATFWQLTWRADDNDPKRQRAQRQRDSLASVESTSSLGKKAEVLKVPTSQMDFLINNLNLSSGY